MLHNRMPISHYRGVSRGWSERRNGTAALVIKARFPVDRCDVNRDITEEKPEGAIFAIASSTMARKKVDESMLYVRSEEGRNELIDERPYEARLEPVARSDVTELMLRAAR